MASLSHLILFFSFAFGSPFCIANAARKPNYTPHAFILPVTKDKATKQYYTTIKAGSHRSTSLDLVIDLSESFTWYDCFKGSKTTSSLPIPCNSAACTGVKLYTICLSCFNTTTPPCAFDTCELVAYNPFMIYTHAGRLHTEKFAFYSTPDGLRYGSYADTPPLPFVCTFPNANSELVAGARGMLGLANTTLSLPTRLAAAFNIPRKFALCLPSRPGNKAGFGDLFVGGGPYFLPPFAKDVSEVFITTPLILNPIDRRSFSLDGEPSHEYFIDVQSIEVDGEALPINKDVFAITSWGSGGTKLSTVNPYTVLETSVYEALVKAFVAKAESKKKMTRVVAVAPFGTCFSSRGINVTKTGLDVPVIDLVLKDGGKWRIYGSNSMVKVNKRKDVVCLGFVDGGDDFFTSITIGGYQMEDNLLEFDPESSKLRFTSSLMLYGTSCSHFRTA